MTSKTRLAIRSLYLTLVTMLSFVMAAGPCAAADPSTAAAAPASAASEQPLEEIQQLDQIVVRGTRLAVAIADAEDDFFRLYNKLNKDDDYHMSCGYRSLRPGSLITTRVCMPGFYADAYYLSVGAPASSWLQCYGADPMGNGDASSTGPCVDGGYVPPPPELVLMERSAALQNHMMKVIRSDPRLQEMGGHLDDLYHELDAVQHRYAKVRDANRKPVRSNLGPRML